MAPIAAAAADHRRRRSGAARRRRAADAVVARWLLEQVPADHRHVTAGGAATGAASGRR
jgi:hypothetical protein